MSIGVFDSGVGGLSVWRAIAERLPHEDLLYFADQCHCPYGQRSMAEIRCLAEGITAFLIAQGAQVVVVACNTASAAALTYLRSRFAIPIVGMEPAVKPASEHTRSGKVGVIATEVTFQGELFTRLVERFAREVEVYTRVCPGLVEVVEAGNTDNSAVEAMLQEYLSPMLEAGIDQLVLGCTHYSFLRSTIEEIVGPGVEIIDPAPAVARQVERVLVREGLLTGRTGQGHYTFYTSGDPSTLAWQLQQLVGIKTTVQAVTWRKGHVQPGKPR